jgi:hypothetical protein
MTMDKVSLLWFLIYSSEYGLVRGILTLRLHLWCCVEFTSFQLAMEFIP